MRIALALLAIAVVAVFATYGQTIGYGFRYDDYHLVRPWSSAELLGVLHRTWDPTGIEPVFYRPLASWWYAVRFDLFGLNGPAQHALSLAGMAVCAALTGLFIWRETESARAGALGTVIYAIHPAFAYAQAVWLTNQMHLLASLVVLVALLVWQRVRSRAPTAWWPLWLLQILAWGIKEDLVMLAPLLVALTLLRALFSRDGRVPAWSVVTMAVALPVAFFALRYQLLGRLGGYGPLPPPDQAWNHVTSGLLGVFRQVPARRPWQPAASTFSQAVIVGGVLAGFLRRRELQLILTGLLVALAFDLPFVFVTKAEQYHLVALGAVLALTGSLEAMTTLVSGRARVVVGSVLATASLVFLPVTRDIARDFAPCSPITLATDAIAANWWVVPPEVQEWLRAKPAACRANRLVRLPDALMTATWAYGAEIDADGQRVQWTSDQAVIMVRPTVTELRVGLQSPTASPGRSVTVQLRGSGADSMAELTTNDWQQVSLVMTGRSSWLTRMHRVDVAIRPVFVPNEIDPVNPDQRRLGVRLRMNGVSSP